MREICHVYTYLFIFLRQLYPVHYFPFILLYSTLSSNELVYNSTFERSFICRSITVIFKISYFYFFLLSLSFKFLVSMAINFFWFFIVLLTLHKFFYSTLEAYLLPLSVYFSFHYSTIFHFVCTTLFFFYIISFYFYYFFYFYCTFYFCYSRIEPIEMGSRLFDENIYFASSSTSASSSANTHDCEVRVSGTGLGADTDSVVLLCSLFINCCHYIGIIIIITILIVLLLLLL